MRRTYSERMRMPHAVYRCWDASGALLYIGCSVSPEVRWFRWLTHPTATWPHETTRREVTWYPNHWAASDAESAAIYAEEPLHNIHHHATNRVNRDAQRSANPYRPKTPVYHPLLCEGI